MAGCSRQVICGVMKKRKKKRLFQFQISCSCTSVNPKQSLLSVHCCVAERFRLYSSSQALKWCLTENKASNPQKAITIYIPLFSFLFHWLYTQFKSEQLHVPITLQFLTLSCILFPSQSAVICFAFTL